MSLNIGNYTRQQQTGTTTTPELQDEFNYPIYKII